MTGQEKLWAGGKTILYAIRPLVLYLVVPGICMGIGMILRRYPGGARQFTEESGNFYTLVSLGVVAALLHRAAKKRGSSVPEEATLYVQGQNRRLAVLCLGLGICLGLLLSAGLTLVPLPGWLKESYGSSSSAMFRQRDLVVAVANVAVLAPVVEEILFRGYMLNRLLTFFDEKAAVYISAFVFALCHVNPVWMIYSFGMGVFLARISLERDNIYYSCLIHVGFNLPSALLAFIQAFDIGKGMLFDSPVLILLYGLTGAAAGRLVWTEMGKERNL